MLCSPVSGDLDENCGTSVELFAKITIHLDTLIPTSPV